MEWFLVLLGFAGIVAAKVFAAERVRRGDRRFVWLFLAPTLFFALAMIWSSLTLLGRAPVAGLVLLVVGVINALLLIRMVRATASTSSSEAELGT